MKFFCVFLLLFCFCKYDNEVNLYSSEDYVLASSFGFYKGSKSMSEIESITFQHFAPSEYDEKWNAGEKQDSQISGYLCGKDVIIVSPYFYTNSRCSYMFAAENQYGDKLWYNLKEINGLELLNTSKTKNMKMMFAFTQLEVLDGISNWDVSNVKTFAGMFQGHSNSGDIKVKDFDIQSWDTFSAENLSHMFYGCALVEDFPIQNWNVSNVKTFSHMFADCFCLKDLDISKWNTHSAENFDAFLNDCYSLEQIDVSNLQTQKCKQFSQMFEGCKNLKQIIGINNWNVFNASYHAFAEMFHNCEKLEKLDLSNWRASPDNTARMFKNCFNLSFLDISGLDLSKIETDFEMFMNCGNLKNS